MLEERRKKERSGGEDRVYSPETYPVGQGMTAQTVFDLVIQEAQRALPEWKMELAEQDDDYTKVRLESKLEALTFEYRKRS